MDGAWRETCCSRANLKLSRPIPELENIVRTRTGNPVDEPKTNHICKNSFKMEYFFY
jgi:hypothetical protein